MTQRPNVNQATLPSSKGHTVQWSCYTCKKNNANISVKKTKIMKKNLINFAINAEFMKNKCKILENPIWVIETMWNIIYCIYIYINYIYTILLKCIT